MAAEARARAREAAARLLREFFSRGGRDKAPREPGVSTRQIETLGAHLRAPNETISAGETAGNRRAARIKYSRASRAPSGFPSGVTRGASAGPLLTHAFRNFRGADGIFQSGRARPPGNSPRGCGNLCAGLWPRGF